MRYAILFLFICLSLLSKAQVDSMSYILDQRSLQSLAQLHAWNITSDSLKKTDPKQGVILADRAISLAQKLKSPSELAHAYINKAANLYYTQDNGAGTNPAIANLNKAMELYEKSSDIEGMIKTFTWIGIIYLNRRDKNALEPVLKKAIAVCDNHHRPKDKAGFLYTMASMYLYAENLISALDCLQKSLTLSESLGDLRTVSKCYTVLGVVNGNIREYDKSIENFKKALEINQRVGDKQMVADILNNMCVAYTATERYNESLKCIQQSYAIQQETGNTPGMSKALHNMAFAYQYLKDYPRAIECRKKSSPCLLPAMPRMTLHPNM